MGTGLIAPSADACTHVSARPQEQSARAVSMPIVVGIVGEGLGLAMQIEFTCHGAQKRYHEGACSVGLVSVRLQLKPLRIEDK